MQPTFTRKMLTVYCALVSTFTGDLEIMLMDAAISLQAPSVCLYLVGFQRSVTPH